MAVYGAPLFAHWRLLHWGAVFEIMTFASWQFIFLFLPITVFGYFLLNEFRLTKLAKVWLVGASLVFYCYWSLDYLPLLLGSICFNFVVGVLFTRREIASASEKRKKALLIFAIAANLALLGYYKYANFFVKNLNTVGGFDLSLASIALPLGISFFTFTQIAYLVDSYKGKVQEYGFVNYALFVTFFPHLIAGPILHHKDMMSQFGSRWTLRVKYRNVLLGLFLFSIGLFKKVVIADTFAKWANAGFDSGAPLVFFEAWSTSLAYTFQLYFDFSGYSDMAVGAGLLFNIRLPFNFNSPYKALDIQDFWRRWHITLSNFLRDYLYIPLGGNRCSTPRIYFNLFITFVLGGLWHGASWMFVIWGAMHGAALVVHKFWKSMGLRMPSVLAWTITFLFVNLAWVFFRAKTMEDAMRVLGGMVNFGSVSRRVQDIPTEALAWGGGPVVDGLLLILPNSMVAATASYAAILFALMVCAQKNSFQLAANGISSKKLAGALVMIVSSLYITLASTSSVFLYFNF